MKLSRQEHWRGLPFPSPEDLPDPGIESRSLASHADALPSELLGKLRYIPKRIENSSSNKKLYANIHCSIISNSQNVEITQMSINGWNDNICYTRTVEYYPAIKKNEVLILATTWMNHENIKVHESSQSWNSKYSMIQFIWNAQNKL